MTDIGPMLREARMHAGLDIDDVEERTKIRAKYLRALENEEWALLPGSAFTKGFLRSYADVVGLDGGLLVDEYKRQWEEPHELDVNPVRPTIGLELREPAWSGGRARRWALLGLTVVVLAVALVLVGHLLGSSTPTGPSSPGSALGTGTSGLGTGPTQTTLLASCDPVAGHHLPAACVSLAVEPSAALYVCVVGDKRIRVDGRTLGAVGTPATYHARKFYVTLGSHSAVLLINGRRFALPAGTGALRYEITAYHRRRLSAPVRLRCVA
jgi:cytoskeleton protein RodZ